MSLVNPGMTSSKKWMLAAAAAVLVSAGTARADQTAQTASDAPGTRVAKATVVQVPTAQNGGCNCPTSMRETAAKPAPAGMTREDILKMLYPPYDDARELAAGNSGGRG
jgi:hypothetical protein